MFKKIFRRMFIRAIRWYREEKNTPLHKKCQEFVDNVTQYRKTDIDNGVKQFRRKYKFEQRIIRKKLQRICRDEIQRRERPWATAFACELNVISELTRQQYADEALIHEQVLSLKCVYLDWLEVRYGEHAVPLEYLIDFLPTELNGLRQEEAKKCLALIKPKELNDLLRTVATQGMYRSFKMLLAEMSHKQKPSQEEEKELRQKCLRHMHETSDYYYDDFCALIIKLKDWDLARAMIRTWSDKVFPSEAEITSMKELLWWLYYSREPLPIRPLR